MITLINSLLVLACFALAYVLHAKPLLNNRTTYIFAWSILSIILFCLCPLLAEMFLIMTPWTVYFTIGQLCLMIWDGIEMRLFELYWWFQDMGMWMDPMQF